MNTNLGSIELVGVDKQCYTDGKIRYRRKYQGLSDDFDKLPVSEDMAAGSSCLFLDTGARAEYHSGTETWYLLENSGTGGNDPGPIDPSNTATDKEVKDLLDNIFGSENAAVN